MATAEEIGDRIVRAVLSRRLFPGERLGESDLASLCGCSRTIVREALNRLAARGIVHVRPRRGWFLADPGPDELRKAFQARLVIETGLIRLAASLQSREIARLRSHLDRQRAALDGSDAGRRSLLLGDFHICLAECFGNPFLTATLRDLTVRSTLSALQHQSRAEAAQSFAEHLGIFQALELGDMPEAEARMAAHLGSWEAKLQPPIPANGLQRLRDALDIARAEA
ncbi:GntR family transcriptional regulator [Roseococcus sp. YIM B11640]|uniref:GntR family transcriptional regulator n=1 Tax=Roseococcus sp. YIM B11640 TaxID=3133973 RepID=UPI003C7EBEEA